MKKFADELNIANNDALTAQNGSGGSFEVTHALVLSIAIPMTIGYLTTPIMGLVDTAVIGQLGVAALIGGLAVGTILVDIGIFHLQFSAFGNRRTNRPGFW